VGSSRFYVTHRGWLVVGYFEFLTPCPKSINCTTTGGSKNFQNEAVRCTLIGCLDFEKEIPVNRRSCEEGDDEA
jgi:hypothetical protein